MFHRNAPIALSFTLASSLLLTACGGQTPAPSSPVHVGSAAAPCPSVGTTASLPAFPDGLLDPLILVGGDHVMLLRVDVAAILNSPYAADMRSLAEAFAGAEGASSQAAHMVAAALQTEVFALGLNPDHGVTFVAKGSYSQDVLSFLQLTDLSERREHRIHSRRRHRTSAVVARGQYLVIAERVGVEDVLDRLDGLEDPSPLTQPILRAAESARVAGSYATGIGVVNPEFRRHMRRERNLGETAPDFRWAAISAHPSGTSVHVEGRVHTVSQPGAARAIAIAEGIRTEVIDHSHEVPELAQAALNLSLEAVGNDGVLLWDASESEVRPLIQSLRDRLEEQAARRQAYRDEGSATATSSGNPVPPAP